MVLVAVLVMDLVKIQPVMVVQMVRMGAAPGSTAIQNFLARGYYLGTGPSAGAAGTGGGGGGCGAASVNVNSGSGGSGAVVITW